MTLTSISAKYLNIFGIKNGKMPRNPVIVQKAIVDRYYESIGQGKRLPREYFDGVKNFNAKFPDLADPNIKKISQISIPSYKDYSFMTPDKLSALVTRVKGRPLSAAEITELEFFSTRILPSLENIKEHYLNKCDKYIFCGWASADAQTLLSLHNIESERIVMRDFIWEVGSVFPHNDLIFGTWVEKGSESQHCFLIFSLCKEKFVLDLAADQFVYTSREESGPSLGLFIMPIKDLTPYSWPYTGGCRIIENV